MNSLLMNTKHGKISNSHRLLLNLTDKIDLNRKIIMFAL